MRVRAGECVLRLGSRQGWECTEARIIPKMGSCQGWVHNAGMGGAQVEALIVKRL